MPEDAPPRTRLQYLIAKRPAASTLLLFGAVWALCLAPFALDGTLPGSFAGDTNRLFVPFRAYVTRQLAMGNFPDLAAGLFLGQPTLTYGQISLLYPTTLLGSLLPLPHHAYFLIDLWLHLACASAAAALLLLGRGHSWAAALALGWVYANSSAVLLRSWGHWTLLHQTPLIPLVLLLWERLPALARPKIAPAMGLAALLGLMILAHNPQWLYLLVVLVLPMELGRSWTTRRVFPPGKRLLFWSAVAGGAALLGASVLVPMASGFGDSFRSLLSGPELARRWDLAPGNLLTVISPYSLFGASPAVFHGSWSPVESMVVVGRGTLFLSVVGLLLALARPRGLLRKQALPLWLVAGGLLLGTAPSTPWFEPLTRNLPLYDSFRSWGRASIFVVLGLIMLAATGLDTLVSSRRTRNCSAAVGIGVLLAAAAAICLWMLKTIPASAIRAVPDVSGLSASAQVERIEHLTQAVLRDFGWYALWTALAATGAIGFHRLAPRLTIRMIQFVRLAAAFLLVLELFFFQRFVFRERAPVLTPAALPELTAWLQQERTKIAPAPYTTALLPPELANFALHLEGIRGVGGADSNMRAGWGKWINSAQGYPPDSYQLDAHLEIWSPTLVEGTGLQSVVQSKTAPGAVGVPVGNYLIGTFAQTYPYAEILGMNGAEAPSEGTVRVIKWEEDYVRLETNAGQEARLRIREFPDRRWRASINDRKVAAASDGANLLLTVPADRNQIELRYVDLAARFGLGVSIAAWLLLLGIRVRSPAVWRIGFRVNSKQ